MPKQYALIEVVENTPSIQKTGEREEMVQEGVLILTAHDYPEQTIEQFAHVDALYISGDYPPYVIAVVEMPLK